VDPAAVPDPRVKRVVFACVHNAGRSQMAAAWFNWLAGNSTPNSNLQTPKGQGAPSDAKRGRRTLAPSPFPAESPVITAISAGTAPAERVHPEVVAAMKEVGIDLSSATPQKLTADLARTAHLLVTMGCGDACPYVPGLRVVDWPLEDPKGKPMERVREIRDDIRHRVQGLIDKMMDIEGR
jgi:arsenate reductase (thioredoxin)